MSHPSSCTDRNCTLRYVEHLRDVSVSPQATPSRAVTRNEGQPDEPTTVTRARERRFERDLPAYKRMRDAGLQPRATRGAAAEERRLGG